MNISAQQTKAISEPNSVFLNTETLSEELNSLKVSELHYLLMLSQAKIGDWVPLSELRGNEKPSSTLSRSLVKLQENNWISTKKDPNDGRGKQLRLTTKGRHRLKPLFARTSKSIVVENREEFPHTTRRRFLTAKTALNIPSKEGTGDWHFFETFLGSSKTLPKDYFIAGENIEDTNHIFGNQGIFECSKLLKEAGVEVSIPVFAADHYRAMADLIYQRLHDEKSLQSLRADDWFPAKTDRRKLGKSLDQLNSILSAEQIKKLKAWRKEQDVG